MAEYFETSVGTYKGATEYEFFSLERKKKACMDFMITEQLMESSDQMNLILESTLR